MRILSLLARSPALLALLVFPVLFVAPTYAGDSDRAWGRHVAGSDSGSDSDSESDSGSDSDGDTDSDSARQAPDPDTCDRLSLEGDAGRLCHRYCVALDCDENPRASHRVCSSLGEKLAASAAGQGVTLAVEDGTLLCLTPIEHNGPFPPNDPDRWVCEDPFPGPTQEQIDEFCATADRGKPLPDRFRNPPPLADLEAKNAYDLEFNAFLKLQSYSRTVGPDALGWISDPDHRFTGPYVGLIPNGSSYSTHLPVKIYYSPEVIDWLCDGREGELTEGATIVKEMHLITENLGVVVEDDGCMTITNDAVQPEAWTVMVKRSGRAFDTWYWPTTNLEIPRDEAGNLVNPPLLDASAFTRPQFVPDSPIEPNPLWYPTGYWPEAPNNEKIPNVVIPLSGYGSFCMACHTSAEKEYTFASLDNILGHPIRYKQFLRDPDAGPVRDRDVHAPPGFVPSALGEPTGDRPSPYTSPLPEPSAEFLAFFDQLDAVPFSEVWETRLPAQTYDHVVSAAGGPDSFLTSDQCVLCHDTINYLDSSTNMSVKQERDGQTEVINLSPYGEWSVSPMGLAGRDPIFFAQLESETNNLAAHAKCIENTCLHCHATMGQRQLAADTPDEVDPECESFFGVAPPPGVPAGRPFGLDLVSRWPGSDPVLGEKAKEYGALARDGISCAVCHRISKEALGTESSYTGNYVTDSPDRVNGPYEGVIKKPMQNALGITPRFGEQILGSELCGSCHAILLPVFRNDGVRTGFKYEQTTYLEWLNSDFSRGRDPTECQGCHMPDHFDDERLSFKIANFESSDFPPTSNRLPDSEITLQTRDRFARHSLHGLNVFLNEFFQQFPLLLGFRQGTFFNVGSIGFPPLIMGEESMIDMAQNQTAGVRLEKVRVKRHGGGGGTVGARVRVRNLAGHFLPSGVGFRRAFLELLVRGRDGEVLWASGRTNAVGALLEGRTDVVLPGEQPAKFPDAPFQPHYEVLREEDEVQIYQELVKDSAGELTSSFLRRVDVVKDNRIRPKGYDPEFYETFDSELIQALAETPGRAGDDPYYIDPELTGADVIRYKISLDAERLSRAHKVEVTLYSQSIPPPYLQQRFRDASRGPGESREIDRLFYMASHLNVDAVDERDGRKVLESWKLLIGRDRRTVHVRGGSARP